MLQSLAAGQWTGAPTVADPQPPVGGRTKSGRRWWIEHRSPGLIEYLQDAAYGRTRLGESTRRSTDTTTPLPVHLDGSALLDDIHTMLTRWVETVNLNVETLSVETLSAEE